MTPPRSHDPGELLSHPIVLAALAVWALNDHLLKARLAGWVTGKLSDVACLIVVPVLVSGAVELWRHARGRPARARGSLMAAALGAAAVMAAINLWTPAAQAYELGYGWIQLPMRTIASIVGGHGLPDPRPVALTMDPSDLLTLPAAALPIWLDARRGPWPERSPSAVAG